MPTHDPFSTWQRIESFLKRCKHVNIVQVNNDLKNIFNDLLFVERDKNHTGRSFELYENIKTKIEKSGISKNDMGNIKRSLDKSLLHEGFLYEVFIDNLKNNKYSANLIKSIAPCYFAISEKSNYNTLSFTPFNNQDFGSILRKNSLNSTYAFLYSPDFSSSLYRSLLT